MMAPSLRTSLTDCSQLILILMFVVAICLSRASCVEASISDYRDFIREIRGLEKLVLSPNITRESCLRV